MPAKRVSKSKSLKRLPKKRQSRFSPIKALIIIVAVIVLGSLFLLFKSTPTSIPLALFGAPEDYLTPERITINAITDNKNILSDSPEVNAMLAVSKAKQQDPKASSTQLKKVAEDAIEETYHAAAATGVINPTTAQTAIQAIQNPTVAPKTEADKETVALVKEQVKQAVEYADKLEVTKDPNDGSKNIITYKPSAPASASIQLSQATCQAGNGMTIRAGETVLGATGTIEGSSGSIVYECQENGSWKSKDCIYDPANPNVCPISLKPTYFQNEAKSNCIVGNSLISHGAVIEDNKMCDNGVLVEAKTTASGTLTADELKKREKTCVDNGGKWNKELSICGAGERSKSILDSATEYARCIANGHKWIRVYSNGEAVGSCDSNPAPGRADSRHTTPYSKQGCENARNKDAGETCQQSKDNPNLWLIVPRGGVVGNSGVANNTSSEITAGNSNYNGILECNRALAQKGSGYTCEPIAGGNYYKLTPISDLPAARRELVPTNFGQPSSQLDSPAETTDPNLRKVEKATDCHANEKSRVIRGPEGGIFCEKLSPSDTRLDPTIVTYENGKVGVYTRDPSECKYAHGAVKPEGSSMYICPNEGGLSIPALSLQVGAVVDNAVPQTKTLGYACGSREDCRSCEKGGVYTFVSLANGTTARYCGTESEVKTYLDTNEVNYNVVNYDSTSIQTLKTGDICDNSLLSKNKCNKCPGETYSDIRIGESVLKVCGSSTVADQIDLVSAQDAIKDKSSNDTRNILAPGLVSGIACGIVFLPAAIPCAIGGAIIGSFVSPNDVSTNLLLP